MFAEALDASRALQSGENGPGTKREAKWAKSATVLIQLVKLLGPFSSPR